MLLKDFILKNTTSSSDRHQPSFASFSLKAKDFLHAYLDTNPLTMTHGQAIQLHITRGSVKVQGTHKQYWIPTCIHITVLLAREPVMFLYLHAVSRIGSTFFFYKNTSLRFFPSSNLVFLIKVMHNIYTSRKVLWNVAKWTPVQTAVAV